MSLKETTTSVALREPIIELYSRRKKKKQLLKERNKVLFFQEPSLPQETQGKLGLLHRIFPLVVEEDRERVACVSGKSLGGGDTVYFLQCPARCGSAEAFTGAGSLSRRSVLTNLLRTVGYETRHPQTRPKLSASLSAQPQPKAKGRS